MNIDRSFTSSDGRFRVHISGDVFDAVLSLCTKAGLRETGGILVGNYGSDLIDVFVTRASGPGRGSVHGSRTFFRAVGHLQEWLDRFWNHGGGYYVGEWHFHPRSSPTPSGVDRRQMLKIAIAPGFNCPEPTLVIIGGNPEKEWSVAVSVFTRGGDVAELFAD